MPRRNHFLDGIAKLKHGNYSSDALSASGRITRSARSADPPHLGSGYTKSICAVASAKSEKCQNGYYDDDQTDDIDKAIHRIPPNVLNCRFARLYNPESALPRQ